MTRQERRERRPVYPTAAPRTRTWRGVFRRWTRRGRVEGIGVLVGLLAVLLIGEWGAAQTPDAWRLRVRPAAAATGQSTARAGEQPLDSLATVYVPAACVGTRRCQLALVLRAAPDTTRTLAAAPRAFADRYGVIVLAVEGEVMFGLDTKSSGNPFLAGMADDEVPKAMRRVDSLLQQVLGSYAIDPRNIALVSERGRDGTLGFGCANLDVFSRLALLSPQSDDPQVCYAGVPRDREARAYVSGGLGEPSFVGTAVRLAQNLRLRGYAVGTDLALRGYPERPADVERLWRWLGESWAVSATPSSGSVPPADPDAGSLLTAEALRQVITFWTQLLQAPDSIKTAARLAPPQQIMVPVQAERFALSMMDTPALAARYPAVVAALRAAGLTAQQADAYRTALIVAAANMATLEMEKEVAPIPAASPLGGNLAFMQTHRDLLKALGSTGMWTTP